MGDIHMTRMTQRNLETIKSRPKIIEPWPFVKRYRLKRTDVMHGNLIVFSTDTAHTEYLKLRAVVICSLK